MKWGWSYVQITLLLNLLHLIRILIWRIIRWCRWLWSKIMGFLHQILLFHLKLWLICFSLNLYFVVFYKFQKRTLILDFNIWVRSVHVQAFFKEILHFYVELPDLALVWVVEFYLTQLIYLLYRTFQYPLEIHLLLIYFHYSFMLALQVLREVMFVEFLQ